MGDWEQSYELPRHAVSRIGWVQDADGPSGTLRGAAVQNSTVPTGLTPSTGGVSVQITSMAASGLRSNTLWRWRRLQTMVRRRLPEREDIQCVLSPHVTAGVANCQRLAGMW